MTVSASNEAPKFSVVVVSYNCLEPLKRCLTSVREHSPECECIVVDNASRDGTREYLENYPGPKILNEDNRGFSRACNQGAALAKGRYLVFLNPDTMVTRGWLETMAGYFNLDRVGAVGPTSNYVAGLQKAELYLGTADEQAGGIHSRIRSPMQPEAITNIAQTLRDKNRGRGISTKLLIGFCLMIPRSLFEELEGMDEKLFLGNDDLDLSWRLQLKGYRLVVASDAFVYHEGQKSFQSEPNETVSRLVQESTDALYDKLIRHYGSESKMPSSQDLWGMSWFHPSANAGRGGRPDSLQPKTQSTREDEIRTRDEIRTHLEARKNIQTVVIGHPDWGGAEALSGTVASLRDDLRNNLICIGHGCSIASTVEFAEGMKLELSAQTPRKKVVEKILSLAEGDYLFLVTGGLEVTPEAQEKVLANLSLPEGFQFPVRPLSGDRPLQESPPQPFHPENHPLALLAPQKVLSRWTAQWPETDFWRQLQERLQTPMDIPPLAYVHELESPQSGVRPSGEDPQGPGQPEDFSFPAVEDPQAANDYPGDPARYQEPGALPGEPGADGDDWSGQDTPPSPEKHFTSIENLPRSLKAYITEARCPLFGSTENEGWMNLQGANRDPAQGDLYILRVYTDTRDRLASHLQDLRVQGNPEARWILLALHHAPLGKSSPKEVENFKNLLFETEKKAWENGLVVESIEPYRGVKPPEGVAASESPGYQFLCRPRTSEYILDKKVSIIILGFNQVAYTRKCIESIREHTRQNVELILVDNGSQDETSEYFRSIPGAKVKINSSNLGVARGWNQALRLATGDYLLLMNNDTVVTPHWLENMVRLAESHPDIGIVGPRSNNISGPQKAEGSFGNDDASIFKDAQAWQRKHELSAFPFDRITGFCMLISRPAFEKIGLFDERFGKGNFEDDDYCMRARYLGYRLLIANDSFVFHYGSVSYRQESVDWQQLMMQNARKFKEKWEKGKSAVDDTHVREEGDPSKETEREPGPAQIKSDHSPNEAGPEHSQTKETYSRNSLPAEDSVKENGSLQTIMDEALGHYNQGRLEEAKQLFLKAVEKDPQCAEAYNGLGILSFHQDQYADALSLFRKALEINPGDEDTATNILDVIKKACGPGEAYKILNALLVDFSDNPVLKAELERVSPIPTREDETKWKDRVENLIREKRYQEALDHIEPRIKSSRDLASCYNYMGIIAFECKDPQTAWEHFKRSLQYNLMDEDVLINYFDAGITLGKQEEVLSTFKDVFQDPHAGKKLVEIKHAYDQLQLSVQNHRLNPDELISSREKNLTGENLIREGMLDKAQEVFEEILKEEPDDFRSNNNMGLLAWYHGNLDEAWTFFTRALTLHPTYTDALINGFDVALRKKNIREFQPYLEKFLEKAPKNQEALNIKKHIETKGEAIYDVRTFDNIDPVNSKLAQAESDLHEGRYNQSILKFLDVLEENPQCFSAYNGLGVIAFNRKMYKEAFKLILLAVENNPLDATSLLNLWEVAKVLGVEAQVIGRLSSAVQIDPSMKEVKAVVEGYGG